MDIIIGFLGQFLWPVLLAGFAVGGILGAGIASGL